VTFADSTPAGSSVSRVSDLDPSGQMAQTSVGEITLPITSPIIAAEHLGKTYRVGKLEVPALRDVSFAVERGEFCAIVGPSGSGKSTLFYILGGLTRATSGHVRIDGVDFAALTDAERTKMRKTKIGFVFQKFNLLPTLTALGNIEIAHEIAGGTEPLDRRRLDELTEMLGVAGRLLHRPSELSGGEQQRVAILRALVTKPAIILADEPTGNLDTKNSDAVLDMLRHSNKAFGQTVLMITHNPEAAAFADRILHMRDGALVEQR
jgi:putative ABC transport system ATP-binding protein